METSEEKTLPASHKKLADARGKGKIAKSADAVAAANLAVGIVVLFAFGGLIAHQITDLLDAALGEAASAAAGDASLARFGAQLSRLASALVVVLVAALAPLALAGLAASVIANIVLNKGVLFTLSPMTPSLEALDPIKGLKRIFGKRGLFEFGKALLKLVVMGLILAIVVLHSLDSMVRLPVCGFGCVLDAVRAPLAVIAGTALLLFVVAGAIDVLIQRRLFLDEMKMTKTEVRKERKEQEGDPTIRSARRRLAREAANESFALGAKAASLFVYGPEAMVGLRYAPSESRVPIVVARASAPANVRLFAAARDTGAPILQDPRLAALLVEGGRPGKPIPNALFHDVARALWICGLARRT